MKKIISVFLSVIILISVFSVCADSETYYDGYPVVLVPGYASASLCYSENGKTYTAWGWELNDILPAVIQSIPSALKGIDDFSKTGDNSKIIEAVGDCLLGLFDNMRCNPDGTSEKNVRPVLFSAEETCDKYMNKVYPDGDYRVELDMTKALDELVGEENVFYFNCDFRMGAVDCAEELDKYIEDVKKYTGSEKVNIVAVSHGGLITATYLSLYADKCDTYNVVMNEPALAGAGIAADLLKGRVNLDEETLVRYLEYHSMCETDINWIVRAHQLGFLDSVIEKIIPQLKQGVLYWNSLWDFMSPDDYEDMKKEHLDPEKSAKLIKNSDYIHYFVMPEYRKIFETAEKNGTRVNIIAGSGNRILSGQNDISDGIITVKSSTGAYCAPFGKRFSDEYVKYAVSRGRIISPSMDIDATECYLPENTWIVNGLFHGMEFWDVYSRNLLFMLLMTDKPVNVNTYSEYPQFRDTSSATSDIMVKFDSSNPGYLTEKDSNLVITNCSQKYDSYITGIKSEGIELDFDLNFYCLKAGESKTVRFSGKLPEGLTYFQITVCYIMSGSTTPLSCRNQIFTCVNGNGGSASSSEITFTDTGFDTVFDKSEPSLINRIVKKAGLQELVNIIEISDKKRLIKYYLAK